MIDKIPGRVPEGVLLNQLPRGFKLPLEQQHSLAGSASVIVALDSLENRMDGVRADTEQGKHGEHSTEAQRTDEEAQ